VSSNRNPQRLQKAHWPYSSSWKFCPVPTSHGAGFSFSDRPNVAGEINARLTLAAIADAGASFKSLGDQWADTTTPRGRLMLTVLGGLAEFERHLILARTSEGRKRAQQRGVRFGRNCKLTPHQQAEALARRARGEALVDIARSYAVSHSTISRLEAKI
jgi:DNA invertase Pin-like site-specific DNA recombinase